MPVPVRAWWAHLLRGLEKLEALSGWRRLALLTAAYALAFVVALAVVMVYVVLTSGPDRDASSGMHAFGDFLLFLVVFGTVSLVPTAASLYLMRRSRLFWLICSALALLVAFVSAMAVGAWFLGRHVAGHDASFSLWEALAIPVFFASPFLFATFALSALTARGAFRWLLGAAAVIEGGCAVYALVWFASALLTQRAL